MSPEDIADSLDEGYNPGAGELLTDGGPEAEVESESEIGHEFMNVIEDHIDFLEKRSLEYKELDREYENLQDDHGDVLDNHIESMKDLRNRYRDVMDDHIDELEDLRKEQRRISKRGTPNRIEVINDRLEDLEDFKTRYRGLLDEYESLAEEHEELQDDYNELFEDHRTLHRDHLRTLRDFSDDKEGDRNRNILEGAAFIGTGLLAAQTYSAVMGVGEFYANSPGIYGEDPGMMFFTLGLPVIGTYMLAKSFDDHTDSEELDNRIDRLETQEKFEDLRRET